MRRRIALVQTERNEVSKVLKSEIKGRTVAGIVNSVETLEGGGFLVRRPFPTAGSRAHAAIERALRYFPGEEHHDVRS